MIPELNKIYQGDCLEIMKQWPDDFIDCVVTSPPYFGLRDYSVDGQIGLESTPEEFTVKIVKIFSEIKRVIKKSGTLWLNLGDSYCGSWGNAGHRPELDAESGGQRPKKSNYIPRGGWDDRRDRPASSYKLPGIKPKDLIGIPWKIAFALRDDGWYLRSDIIWHKPNPMPESVRDRPTKSHEYIFLMTKSGKPTIWRSEDTNEWSEHPDLNERIPSPTDEDPNATRPRWAAFSYYYNADAIAEKISEESMRRYARVEKFGEEFDRLRHKHHNQVAGRVSAPQSPMEVLVRAAQNVVDKGTRNKRDVWTVPVQGYKFAHFATFPEKLIEPCILAGCPEGGIVLDPFFGSGTTGVVAKRMSCNFIGCELNSEYIAIANKRLAQETHRLF